MRWRNPLNSSTDISYSTFHIFTIHFLVSCLLSSPFPCPPDLRATIFYAQCTPSPQRSLCLQQTSPHRDYDHDQGHCPDDHKLNVQTRVMGEKGRKLRKTNNVQTQTQPRQAQTQVQTPSCLLRMKRERKEKRLYSPHQFAFLPKPWMLHPASRHAILSTENGGCQAQTPNAMPRLPTGKKV